MNLADVKAKSASELAELAHELAIDNAESMRRQDLIYAILRARTQQRGVISAEGVLEILPDGFGFLRAPDANYLPGADDIYVSPSQIRRFDLRTGDTVTGHIRAPKESERYFALLKVEAINHGPPDAHKNKRSFDELTPVYPCKPLALEHDPACLVTRAIDLVSPLGKGQRCLVAAPPRSDCAGLLAAVAKAIETNHPDAELLVLLIDERPEDVTAMKRATRGHVIASTFDEPATRHVQVADIVIDKARRLAENGADVVLLLDSLTRLARAYNAVTPPSGKVVEGGLDPAALHKPKRLFGAARNLEEGGSLTIIATAVIGTGSRTDEVIYEELAHAANCEIRLDDSGNLGVAIDPSASATHNEALLRDGAICDKVRQLRSELDSASALRTRLAGARTNDELL